MKYLIALLVALSVSAYAEDKQKTLDVLDVKTSSISLKSKSGWYKFEYEPTIFKIKDSEYKVTCWVMASYQNASSGISCLPETELENRDGNKN